jgi:hypothetical protein
MHKDAMNIIRGPVLNGVTGVAYIGEMTIFPI